MRKLLRAAMVAAVFSLIFGLAACRHYDEVAGTYEMTSITGTVNGQPISEENYEYFRIILNANGSGLVQSKGAAEGSEPYEADGTFRYKDGMIRFNSRTGIFSVTEEYAYADGVITYSYEDEEMSFTIVLTRVEQSA